MIQIRCIYPTCGRFGIQGHPTYIVEELRIYPVDIDCPPRVGWFPVEGQSEFRTAKGAAFRLSEEVEVNYRDGERVPAEGDFPATVG
jgi:hypothetical protein